MQYKNVRYIYVQHYNCQYVINMYVVQIYDNFDSYVCETTNDLCFVVCGLCCGKKKERVIKNLRSSNLLLI